MKSLIPALALSLTAGASFSHAQVTVSDDFTSSANWSSPTQLYGGVGSTIQVASGVANYVVPNPTAGEVVYMTYTGAFGSYTSNWSVQVDVRFGDRASVFGSGTSNVPQAVDLSLMVVKTDTAPSFDEERNPTFNGYSAAGVVAQSESGGFERWFRASRFSPSSSEDGERLPVETSIGGGETPFGTIRISFDSATKTLTSDYALGDAGVFNSLNLSLDIDGDANWGMTDSDTFSFMLWGSSIFDSDGEGIGPELAEGVATFDNFSVTSVPEPSTYAAIAGCAVLGLAFWRRRSARQRV